MKKVCTLIFCGLAAVTANISAKPPDAATLPLANGPVALDPAKITVVYLAYGRVTTIQLRHNKQVPQFVLGAPIIVYHYDAKLNQIMIWPAAEDGETNLTMTLDGRTYVILLKLVRDRRLEYVVTLTTPNEDGDEDDAGDEAVLQNAHPLKPSDVDIVNWSQQADRAHNDPIYRQRYPAYRYRRIGKYYSWNESEICLEEVHQFLDKDLLLFKVEWVNRAREAVYLSVRQYGLTVADQKIPVIDAMQDAPNSIVFPGQREIVWLAVQGYKLRRENDWELTLPPDRNGVVYHRPEDPP